MSVIGNAVNGMLTMMLAKFMLNDMPHALGLAGTQPNVFYHATTQDAYEASIITVGLTPQPLRVDVAKIVGHDRGTYIANNLMDARDIALAYIKEKPLEKYVILRLNISSGTKLHIDPDVGEPDSPWFIITDIISPKDISAVEFVPDDMPHALDITGDNSQQDLYRDAWSEIKELLYEPGADLQMEESLKLGVSEGFIKQEDLRDYKDLLSGYYLIAKEKASDDIVGKTYHLAVDVWRRYLKFLHSKSSYLDEAGEEVGRAFRASVLDPSRLNRVVFIDAVFHYGHEGYIVVELTYAIPDAYGAYSGWLASELSMR